jgi:hypothetical protein
MSPLAPSQADRLLLRIHTSLPSRFPLLIPSQDESQVKRSQPTSTDKSQS